MNFRSIRFRLTIWYSVVLSLSLIVFSILLWLALRHLLYADLTTNLANELQGFEKYLRLEETDPAFNAKQEIEEYSTSFLRGHILLVCDNRGTIIYTSSPDVSRGDFLATLAADHPFSIRFEHHRYLAATRTFALRQGKIQAFLGVSSTPVKRATDLFGSLLFAATPLFIIFAISGGYFLSRRALLPISVIVEKAKGIGVGNLSERLAVSDTRDELQSLTETWNGMLGRLEWAVDKISCFTADASHELRTPVAIIRLAAESALRKSRSDSEYRDALDKIQRESENMTRLIDDLLFLARADVNESPAAAEPLNLSALIGEVAADLRPIAESKGMTLNESVSEVSLPVIGNSSNLRRLFITLLDNAVKYTLSGGIIQMRAQREDGEAVAQVEDTGVGIPEDAQSRVFERFYRVDSSRSKESGGYGLGLAIAAAIIQQHNGSISVKSRPGEGSIFTVRLPISREPADCLAEYESYSRLNQEA